MRILITLESTGTTENGKPTGTMYVTTINKQANTEKISKKKFDPRAYNKETGKYGMHVVFKQGKIKK